MNDDGGFAARRHAPPLDGDRDLGRGVPAQAGERESPRSTWPRGWDGGVAFATDGPPTIAVGAGGA